jgi:hypothetical protein
MPRKRRSLLFRGQLRDSWLTARGLTTLAKVVAVRPLSGGVARPYRDGRREAAAFRGVFVVRWRVRSPRPRAALNDEFVQSGTTNVDFNEPMVNALSRLGRTERVRLSVGQQDVTLKRAADHVTERKVALPERWVKGVTAALGYLAQMDEKLRLTRAQAAQLLHNLPAGTTKTDTYLVLRGPRSSFSPVGGPNAVLVGGAHRLRLLDGLLPLSQGTRVYATPDDQASAIVLDLGGGHEFLLALSAGGNWGFSCSWGSCSTSCRPSG